MLTIASAAIGLVAGYVVTKAGKRGLVPRLLAVALAVAAMFLFPVLVDRPDLANSLRLMTMVFLFLGLTLFDGWGYRP